MPTRDDNNGGVRKQRRGTTRSRTRRVILTAAGAIPLAVSMAGAPFGGKSAKTTPVPATAPPSAVVLFNPGCPMPFQSSPVAAIDGTCRIEGTGTADWKIAESKAKNDFCALTSKAVPIQYQTFVDLQSKTRFHRSSDRSPLAKILSLDGTTIGEGTYVEYVGFLLNAHYSNKSSGEAVNCNKPGEMTNDIHIEMVKDADQEDACQSVTAEMSPHFRPESWTPDNINNLKDRLIRLRGPLFYDGSHVPCHDSKRPNPQRISVWEIHPVYSVDVCKQKGKNCGDWVSLEEWNGIEGGEEENQ